MQLKVPMKDQENNNRKKKKKKKKKNKAMRAFTRQWLGSYFGGYSGIPFNNARKLYVNKSHSESESRFSLSLVFNLLLDQRDCFEFHIDI